MNPKQKPLMRFSFFRQVMLIRIKMFLQMHSVRPTTSTSTIFYPRQIKWIWLVPGRTLAPGIAVEERFVSRFLQRIQELSGWVLQAEVYGNQQPEESVQTHGHTF